MRMGKGITIFTICMAIYIFGGAIFFGCDPFDLFNSGTGGLVHPTTSTSPTSTYTGPEVVYEITGTADKVDVTLNNASGGTEQYSDVSLPKTYSYYTFDDYFFYISAQNQGETGSVKVTIYYNGEVVESASSSGAYVIASASGTIWD